MKQIDASMSISKYQEETFVYNTDFVSFCIGRALVKEMSLQAVSVRLRRGCRFDPWDMQDILDAEQRDLATVYNESVVRQRRTVISGLKENITELLSKIAFNAQDLTQQKQIL